ncbi:UDP-N-acetylenolpyruvoylglucosamine reductase [candidate division WOR-1 bacterium RIFOXYB2_FULL_48_7]|uniref:UDP-N-acetylenolpyruvoylglucosamine reductase n=1 Tax=candidate division WOR-1 bacterium RIFOXYB2_FULL_48_7 TaxID=1802583 RepID=A0A1F4TM43_UNCSA|nr:MAG: UDP-N-acetylenolpyruvoylglucosamine reductase [candidate division WOR-1 bacterium RIFOXYB2_FULL_48_7]
MKYLRHESLKKHTSFRIGGQADYFCAPKSLAQLKEALLYGRANNLGIAFIGGGTNLLALDKGFRGLAIKLGDGLGQIKINGLSVTVGAGALLPKLLSQLAGKNLSGLEFLAGVPGTVGGAVVMNAGAWGKEIGRYIELVKAIDHDGHERIFTQAECEFAYRHSLFQKGHWLIYEATLRLTKGKTLGIKNAIRGFIKMRRESQPLGIPNAGSVFKNPKHKYAGKLIEEAGCKGMRVGDAQVSTKHANFIVNLGEAKASDVIKLMARVQKIVKDKHRVTLEPELKFMVECKK